MSHVPNRNPLSIHSIPYLDDGDNDGNDADNSNDGGGKEVFSLI